MLLNGRFSYKQAGYAYTPASPDLTSSDLVRLVGGL